MPLTPDAANGNESDPDGYPWSWPQTLPPGGEVPCPFVRDTLRMAEAIGMRRFARNAQREELVNDAVSVAWEMAKNETNRTNGHPGTIALFAVRRVASGLHFTRSERDVCHTRPRSRPICRRRRLHPGIVALLDGSCPADTAGFRIDLADWFASLTERRREVAELLATGHSTTEIADISGCTTNAVRMIRMALRRSFQAYLESAPE